MILSEIIDVRFLILCYTVGCMMYQILWQQQPQQQIGFISKPWTPWKMTGGGGEQQWIGYHDLGPPATNQVLLDAS